jgi:hypothetical protein
MRGVRVIFGTRSTRPGPVADAPGGAEVGAGAGGLEVGACVEDGATPGADGCPEGTGAVRGRGAAGTGSGAVRGSAVSG